MRIRIDTVPVAEIHGTDRERMFALLQRYFLGVRWDVFQRDLEEKDRVMLLRSTPGDAIVGFSTLMRLTLDTPYGPIMVVFSGDTVVEEAHRSYCGFGYGLDVYFTETRRVSGGIPVYYVLISKGWRTYRVLPFLFRTFYPNFSTITPPRIRTLCTAFGRSKYPNGYDANRGIVVGQDDAQRIRPDSPDVISAHRLADPHVAFFTVANPNHDRGDELVCIADVAPENYTPAFHRMVRRCKRGNPCPS